MNPKQALQNHTFHASSPTAWLSGSPVQRAHPFEQGFEAAPFGGKAVNSHGMVQARSVCFADAWVRFAAT